MLGILVCLGVGITATAWAEQAVVKVQWANLRAAPRINAPILAQVSRGEAVEVLERTDGWLKARYRDIVGFIAASLVEEVAPTESPSPAPTPSLTPTPPPSAEPSPMPPPPAESPPRPPSRKPVGGKFSLGVGAGVGYVKPENIDATLHISGNVQLAVTDNIITEAEISYWKKSETAFFIEVSVSDASVGGNVLLRLPAEPLKIYGGAGLGVHFVTGRAEFLGIGASETETKLGIHLLGGLEYGLMERLAVFANGRFDLVSDINQFKIYGGVRFYP